MNIYEFIRMYRERNPRGHYFDRDTIRFFGERLSEMRILKGTTVVKDMSGNTHTCYTLSAKQRRPDGVIVRKHTYFDIETMEDILQ